MKTETTIKTNFLSLTLFLLIILNILSCDKKETHIAKDYRPEILKKLDGEWKGRGRVMGDSVEYLITGKPVLNTMFTQIHMVDVNNPPGYESLVFIGYDSVSRKVFAHWLDTFGGAYSVPHGTGTIDESKIEFFIPYPTSAFRDIFTFDKNTETWKLSIESQVDSLTWKNFASYDITKNKKGN
jgi:hypothetical protein